MTDLYYEVRYLEERNEEYRVQLETDDLNKAMAECDDMIECGNIEAVKIVMVKEIYKDVKVESEYS